MLKDHGSKRRVDKDRLLQYLEEEPEYVLAFHELYTKMTKEILLIIQEKEIDIALLAYRLQISQEELMEYLQLKKESFAMYEWILTTIKNWDKEE